MRFLMWAQHHFLAILLHVDVFITSHARRVTGFSPESGQIFFGVTACLPRVSECGTYTFPKRGGTLRANFWTKRSGDDDMNGPDVRRRIGVQ